MDEDLQGVDSARELLVRQKVSAVCFVRDYVELHFDGPIFRAITAPFGMYGCTGWRLPGVSAAGGLLRYIGLTVDDFVLLPRRYAQLGFGEHSFTVPLDDEARTGPEALHVVGVDERGRTDPTICGSGDDAVVGAQATTAITHQQTSASAADRAERGTAPRGGPP